MKVLGFNFSRISGERHKRPLEGVKTKVNIDVVEITPLDSNVINTKDEILEAQFKYEVTYEPGFAKVLLEGTLLFSLDPKISKEVLTQWKKKQIPEDIRIVLLNVIMKKASPKSISLEDELNIPFHIPMPSFSKKTDKK